MYRKVLIPLDGSNEAEGVFDLIQEELAPGGEVVLLKVIPHARTQVLADQVIYGEQLEEAERSRARTYLSGALDRLSSASIQGTAEVVVSNSVSEGIVGFAEREGVDLIAMYTHDRKGLARLIKGSVAKQVQRKTPINVKIFTPREVAGVT